MGFSPFGLIWSDFVFLSSHLTFLLPSLDLYEILVVENLDFRQQFDFVPYADYI